MHGHQRAERQRSRLEARARVDGLELARDDGLRVSAQLTIESERRRKLVMPKVRERDAHQRGPADERRFLAARVGHGDRQHIERDACAIGERARIDDGKPLGPFIAHDRVHRHAVHQSEDAVAVHHPNPELAVGHGRGFVQDQLRDRFAVVDGIHAPRINRAALVG